MIIEEDDEKLHFKGQSADRVNQFSLDPIELRTRLFMRLGHAPGAVDHIDILRSGHRQFEELKTAAVPLAFADAASRSAPDVESLAQLCAQRRRRQLVFGRQPRFDVERRNGATGCRRERDLPGGLLGGRLDASRDRSGGSGTAT